MPDPILLKCPNLYLECIGKHGGIYGCTLSLQVLHTDELGFGSHEGCCTDDCKIPAQLRSGEPGDSMTYLYFRTRIKRLLGYRIWHTPGTESVGDYHADYPYESALRDWVALMKVDSPKTWRGKLEDFLYTAWRNGLPKVEALRLEEAYLTKPKETL